MTPRSLVVLLALTSLLAACGGSTKNTNVGTSPTPSSTGCTPSGQGTTDLAKKPIVPVPKATPPTVTTTTDIVCGTGKQAQVGSMVEVKYVGLFYSNGQEFDSSWKVSPSYTFAVTVGQGVIPGFSKGIEGMRVGGRREVVIPPADGYGEQANGPIPAGSTLIFVLDLVKVG